MYVAKLMTDFIFRKYTKAVHYLVIEISCVKYDKKSCLHEYVWVYIKVRYCIVLQYVLNTFSNLN